MFTSNKTFPHKRLRYLMGSKPMKSYVKRQKHLFGAFCVIANSWVFYVQMTSCAVRYDVIYHPSPINCQFKVDRLQIIVVAKKYISTCRNCSSVGCLKCVRAIPQLVSAPLNPAIFKIRNGESRNGNGNGNGGRGTGNGERGTRNGESLKAVIFKTGNL